MSGKQNVFDYSLKYPLAEKAVMDFFYVNDGLTGAKSIQVVDELRRQLWKFFSNGGFLLSNKWNSKYPLLFNFSLLSFEILSQYSQSQTHNNTLIH